MWFPCHCYFTSFSVIVVLKNIVVFFLLLVLVFVMDVISFTVVFDVSVLIFTGFFFLIWIYLSCFHWICRFLYAGVVFKYYGFSCWCRFPYFCCLGCRFCTLFWVEGIVDSHDIVVALLLLLPFHLLVRDE